MVDIDKEFEKYEKDLQEYAGNTLDTLITPDMRNAFGNMLSIDFIRFADDKSLSEEDEIFIRKVISEMLNTREETIMNCITRNLVSIAEHNKHWHDDIIDICGEKMPERIWTIMSIQSNENYINENLYNRYKEKLTEKFKDERFKKMLDVYFKTLRDYDNSIINLVSINACANNSVNIQNIMNIVLNH